MNKKLCNVLKVSNTKVLIFGINSNAKIIFWTVIGGKLLFFSSPLYSDSEGIKNISQYVTSNFS